MMNVDYRKVVFLTFILVIIIVIYGFNIMSQTFYYIQAPHFPIDFKYNEHAKQITINNVECKKVTGLSMNPVHFTDNSICYVKYDKQELKEGLIVIYETDKGTAAHRIVGVYNDYVYIKGDNNADAEKVSNDKIQSIIVATLYT